MSILKNIIDILFPKFCLNCGKEGSLLCEDCFSLIDINSYTFCHVCGKRTPDFKICPNCRRKTNLSGIFFATYYKDTIAKMLIQKLKYPPFIREISKVLAKIIISHLSLLEFSFPENSLFVPIPLFQKREKWRGFNQSAEIAKELSSYYGIPFSKDILFKIRETLPQVELKSKERKENIKDSFYIKEDINIKGKTIFLIDDVYTTGSTLEESAQIIKKGKPKDIFGLVVARE